MSPTVRALLLVLFAASLGLNVYLWNGAPARRDVRVVTEEAKTAPRASDSSCAAELQSCLRAANGLAAGVWSKGALPPPCNAAPAPPTTEAGAPSRDGLCRVARGKLREEWTNKRDVISGAMVDWLRDGAKQRADAEQGAERLADGMGIDGRARRGFEADYTALESRHDAALAALTANGTADWGRMIEEVHALYDDEDALVQNQLGADKLATFRSLEGDKRVSILSILATYADSDWDEAIQSYGAY